MKKLVFLILLIVSTYSFALTYNGEYYQANRRTVGSGKGTADPVYKFIVEANSTIDALSAAAPGGSDTYLQYNNDGAFGGISTIIWDDTNLEFQDDQKLAFGTSGDWTVEFDDAVDDQLIFLTAGTGCTAITDPMFEIIVGATPTANQQVFGIAKGTQASNTALFTVDEDGDVSTTGDLVVGGNLTVTGTYTFTGDITLSSGETVTNTTDSEIAFTQNSGEDLILDMDASTNVVGLKSSTGVTGLAMGAVDDLSGVGTIAFDAAAASISTATDGAAQDLTVGITGATNSSLILSSTGTGEDALQVSTSAGGINITVAGAAANEDLDLTSNSSINLTATEAVANQIYIQGQGTVAGNAVNVATTDGGIIIAASGAANGDVAITSADDTSITATDDLTLNGGSAGSIITIGGNTQGNAINIGADDTTADTIAVGSAKDTVTVTGVSTTIGDTTGAAATIIQSGTGDVLITSTDDLNIGTNATAQDIVLGNITGATSLALKCGTGNFSLEGVAASTITIGKSDQTGTMKFGESTGALQVDLATGNSNKTVNLGTGTGVSTINIGTGGTGAKTITIGDAASTGTTNIKAGTGGINFTGSVIRTGQQYVQTIGYCKVGSTGGWVVPAAADAAHLATLPQSQTASTLVIPINIPLKVGYTITAWTINGQIDSGGNTATLDAKLYKHTEATAGFANAAIGSGMAQLSKTADYKVVEGESGLSEVVAADESYYLLVTGTTAATTDIEIAGITVTVSEI
ncbi:MAG: hypothetical protein PHQ00_00030 [Phycisphaerae bacterium]|nr:hypothetical protein [Phycisphaerae bacterium]